ncbi:glycosyltransferase family 2 protein, partial [Patescibacteria group bacterium]|nr:glycosyltransferase family 2 protein [Patescibacteria group bacterium]
NFAKNSQIPCKYVLEKRKGYPTVYNRGLKEAKNTWVAFIDDDCVADVNWYMNIKKRVNKERDVNLAAILGFSDTYYQTDIFSLATNFFDYIWKKNGSCADNDRILDFEILDNKNIAYNKNFLIKNKLSFDESRVKFFNGASEDCDLGRQIFETKKAVAIYDRSIKIWHKDPVNFSWFVKKYLSSISAYSYYLSKWGNESHNLVKNKINFKKELILFIKHHRIKSFKKKSLYILIYFHVVLDYFFLLFYKSKH